MPRFYIPPAEWNAEELALTADEAHHLVHVLRMGVGDEVTVFDGRGSVASAEVIAVQAARVDLKTLAVRSVDRPSTKIAIGQAIPKGRNMELIVQKATELGAAAIHPLMSERTIVRFNRKDAAKKREKWSRVALEACKQSGQNWLPQVCVPQSPADFYGDQLQAYDLKLVASLESDARDLRQLLSEFELTTGARPLTAVVLIGPEGDFTAAEIAAARAAGCVPLGFGPIVLRTETAAIHALSILSYELG
ncbi:MAG: 16S rRNA (uracil1498-N3)-methyltransferase [Verrucomicrobiales bacterium]|jgi:16S rRNA (uracil1498-N3)-methyltransferase